MRLLFIFCWLSLYSCKTAPSSVNDISKLLEKIDHDIFSCSKYVTPEIQIRENETTHHLQSNTIAFIRNRYQVISHREQGCLKISIMTKENIKRVVITCDYPQLEMLTNEPSTFMFELRKEQSEWVLTRVDDLN